MKQCSSCKQVKDDTDFCKRNTSPDGLTGQCKECLNLKHQKYRDNNRESARESARLWAERNRPHNLENTRKWRKRRRLASVLHNSHTSARLYGGKPCNLAEAELEATITGVCAICGVEESSLSRHLCMDHCHATGNFRGWLCFNCNAMLGHVRDNKEVLKNAVSYLENNN